MKRHGKPFKWLAIMLAVTIVGMMPGNLLGVRAASNSVQHYNIAAQVTGVPQNVTAVEEDGKVTLTWGAVTNATAYAVQYLNGNGSWTLLADNCTGTTYTATNLISGKTYTFLVQAWINGGWSKFDQTDYVTATPTGATKPTAKVAAIGDGSVTLNWNAISGASQYAVAYQKDDGSWNTLTYNCTDTTYTVTGLQNRKEFTFLVQSCADGVWSSFDSSDYVKGTPCDASRPIVTATTGDGSAALTWQAVKGATKYAVAYQSGNGWVNLSLTCTDTTYIATNLISGKTYTFLVQAYVDGKWSKFDQTDYVTATPTGATKPIANVTAVGDGSVALSWNSISGATAYAITDCNTWKEFTRTCTDTTYTATNLISGKAYTFLVQAYVDGKWSQYDSTDFVTATPTGATKPTAKVTAIGDGSVALNWNAISGASQYAVAYQKDDGSWDTLTRNYTDTTYTVTGLQNHKEYTFLVQSCADGVWSSFNDSDYVKGTPFDASRPVAAATTGDGSAKLTWEAVKGATKYAVQYQNDNGGWVNLSLTCTDTTYTATNLISGKAYTFLVQAWINGGWSKFDQTDYVTAIPTGATKPTAKVTAVGDSSVTLSWNAVSGASQYAIAYQNEDKSWNTLTRNCTDTTYTVIGLQSHKEYTFLVQFYADGAWSSFDSSDYVKATPFDASRPFIKATAGDGSATLTWDAIEGATVYKVSYLDGGGLVELSRNCTGTTYTAGNLIPGKTYTFVVQAQEHGYWSSYDSADYVTVTPTGPTKPVPKVIAVDDGSVTLSWSAISGATAYAIAYQSGNGWATQTLDCTGTTYTVTGLINHNEYIFLVQAYVNGSWSPIDNADCVKGTPADPTRPVAQETAGNASGIVTLSWNAIPGATEYEVEYQDGNSWAMLTDNCTDTTYTAVGLRNHKEYTFLVKAYVYGKWSRYDSTDFVKSTPFDPTRPNTSVTAGDGSATLTWGAVKGATAYAVAYQNGNSWTTLTLNCTDTTYTATNLVSGKTYIFLVQAKINGKWSPFDDTDYVMATPTGPTKPTARVTSVGDNSVALNWNAVSGATAYAVQYLNSNGSWTLLADNCTGTTYTATNLHPGTTYIFLVQSYADGHWSNFDSPDYVTATTNIVVTPKGIDVSYAQGTIDWQQVKNSGVGFAMIRIGFGSDETDQDDSKAAYNISECERLGIPYGVYLYSYALNDTDASSEAAHILRLLGGRHPIMGVYLDVEDTGYYNRNGLNPFNNFRSELNHICQIEMNALQNAGYSGQTGIYANCNYRRSVLSSSLFTSNKLWLAQWNDSNSFPCAIWQYGGGSIAGIVGNVDLDLLRN